MTTLSARIKKLGEFDSSRVHKEYTEKWYPYPTQDNEGFQPDRMGYMSGVKGAYRVAHDRFRPLIAALAECVEACQYNGGNLHYPQKCLDALEALELVVKKME